MATLPSTLTPIRTDSSDVRKDKKLEVTFGNGYVQRGTNGFNSLDRTVNITFIGSTSDIASYITFFDNLKGYQTFQWTHPHDTESKNWVCGDRTITDLGNNVRQLSTTFILDYSF